MSRYKVLVDDNFHYMDADERWQLGVFPTAEAALAACRKLVDDWLASNHKPGMKADELYKHYTMFGEDPYVIATDADSPKVSFSAWEYARARAVAVCGQASSE